MIVSVCFVWPRLDFFLVGVVRSKTVVVVFDSRCGVGGEDGG